MPACAFLLGFVAVWVISEEDSEEDIMLKASQRFVISTIKAYMTEPRR